MASALFNSPNQNLFGALPIAQTTYSTTPLDSDRSTADTIQLMQQIAKESARHPYIQAIVHDILGACHNPRQAVELLYRWVKRHVHFTEDEAILATQWGYGPDKELLIRPEVLLLMPQPQGDCDDFSLLVATLILAADLGVGVNYVTVAADDMEPDRFSHVYVQVILPPDGEMYYVDASHGHYVGWETSNQFRKAIWPVAAMAVSRGEERKSMLSSRGLGDEASDALAYMQSNVDAAYGVGPVLPGYTPPAAAAPASTSLWSQIVAAAAGTGLSIAKAQYGGVQPGTYVNAKTGVTYRLPDTGATSAFGTFPGGTDLTSGVGDLLKYGLIALVIIMGLRVIKK